MAKCPWHTKSASNRGTICKASALGECISVYQMELRTPGSIAQTKVKPTKHHYHAATIFLDHHSDLTYVHLPRRLSSEETVQTNKTLESYAWMYRVRLRHYHTDNGRFSDNNFLQSVAQENQTISSCGVNYQFWNGKAEKCIRDIQDKARKQLHHAKARCPSAIELAIFTYALLQATYLRNFLPDQ